MYNAYWGFQRSPFSAGREPSRFYESPSHEEALARLTYVVDEARQGALVLGQPGVGKSLLVEVFAERIRRPNRELAMVQLPGFGGRELYFELAQQFGLAPERTATEAELWRSLRDHVTANRLQDSQTVIAVDQAHLLTEDRMALRSLSLLFHLDPHPESRLTVILVARPELMRNVRTEVIELVDLGVVIEPFAPAQTAQYVSHLTTWAGREEAVFTQNSLHMIHELTGGIARQINRVCDLALLAACSEQTDQVTESVVESVYRELSPEAAIQQLGAAV